MMVLHYLLFRQDGLATSSSNTVFADIADMAKLGKSIPNWSATNRNEILLTSVDLLIGPVSKRSYPAYKIDHMSVLS